MAILTNQKDCSVTRKNLGLSDCLSDEGRLNGFILVPVNWSLNKKTDVFDLEYVNKKIQLGLFVPVLGAAEATIGTPEPTTEEYQGGIKSVVRNGKPEFTFKFIKKGWKFANNLYTYNSQQAFRILLTFDTGAIAGVSNGENITGFQLGMLNTGTYMFTDGSVSASVSLTMQLINEAEFNRDIDLLDNSVLGFNVNSDIYPITDIVIKSRVDVSDRKVYFKAVFDSNQAYPLMGIGISNLRCVINGVTDVIKPLSLTFESTTQEWSYEPTKTLVIADKVITELYDSTGSVSCAKIGSRYYKGTSEVAIATA